MSEQQRRWPDFFLVGHHKSGTTAMYEMLRRHPQIFMPALKEPRFMAGDLPSRRPPGPARRQPETTEEYLALFADAAPEQRVGEASATYLFSHTAAERIASVQPSARIIAILREPASFLRSLHTTYLRIQFEDQPDLLRAIALEPARARGEHVPPRCWVPELLRYTEQVHYVEQLRRYEERFDPSQMLVLIYDDFRADNDAVMRRVFAFLDVEETSPSPPLDVNTTTEGYRAPRLDAALTAAAIGDAGPWRGVTGLGKALTTRRLRRALLRILRRRLVLADPPQLDEETTSELRRRFAPEVTALSEHLGRDLVALWGYNRSG